MEYFKTKYQKLHEQVILTYGIEKSLLERAKELKSQLEAERIKLEQRTILAHEQQADIELLMKEEKEWANKLQEATDERNAVTFELEEYRASKQEQANELEARYQKSVTQLNPLLQSLTQKIDELKAEIDQQVRKQSTHTADGDSMKKRTIRALLFASHDHWHIASS